MISANTPSSVGTGASAQPEQPEVEQSEHETRVRTIVRLLLRKGELEVDDQHPILDSGLTVPQMRVLFCAARRGGARPGFIAERTRMAPPNVTSVLDRLTERHLVRRDPDPEDGRATIVLLTEDGKRMVRAMAAAHSARLEGALGVMRPDELDALETGLRALIREMDARIGTPP